MEAFNTSFIVVALAEMGDKTQLLAFSLSSRFRRPWPVMAGILTATIVNHALSAWGGAWAAAYFSPKIVATALALSFLGFGVWTLVPDKYEGRQGPSRFGPFLTTTAVFFLVEIGDKTQLATMALGAKFGAPMAITAGTTLGMMASDGFGVFLGERVAQRIPMHWIRRVTAALFFAFGGWSAVMAARY
ncbi:MAG TPA: hypothetical protein DCZ01_09905 [Elusimicrobia bacterium]|nr:MAG: hypothetical protein A2X37_02910 [Elusimicrobia bacterium GWA2_66_18]OGR70163.1 MAG: hypothetical protein A2X40_05355 [Elusimicrobia bacterium GWC2_65_9]HAZ08813.1 hypothetical protein [Elusimicrobiota bacterium]